MFPASKLFGLCPDWSTCKVFRCPFSHQPQASTSAAASAAAASNAPNLESSASTAILGPIAAAAARKRPAEPHSLNAAPPKRLEQARLARERTAAETREDDGATRDTAQRPGAGANSTQRQQSASTNAGNVPAVRSRAGLESRPLRH